MTYQTKNILVPFDFSKLSFLGLEAAKEWVSRFGAKIHLVCVLTNNQNPPFGPVTSGQLKEKYDLEKQRNLELNSSTLLVKLKTLMDKNIPPGAVGEAYVIQNEHLTTISQFVNEMSIDLIIQGYTWSTSLTHFLKRNQRDHIIDYAEVPVMLVGDINNIRFDSVVAIINLSQSIDESLFELASYLQTNGAELTIAHIMTHTNVSQQEAKKKLELLTSHTELVECDTHCMKVSNEIDGILKVIDMAEADLVLINTDQSEEIEALMTQTLVNALIRETRKPILVDQISLGTSISSHQ